MIKKLSIQESLTKLSVISFILTAAIACSNNQSDVLEQFEQQSSLKIKALATQLKKELSASMQSGGPVAAIQTCKLKAPEITNQLSNTDSIKIKRTSLKLRNPNNAPDAWEQDTLKSFQQQLSSGTPIQELTHSETFAGNNGITLRMMRAIPIQAACLACHGDKQIMSAELVNELKENYPDDLATNYTSGELRGAFSLTQTIHK